MNQKTTPETAELRFSFGQNWARYLRNIDDSAIRDAEYSLREMLCIDSLEGNSFLDVGCGSGLFSFAARRLGASVHSFDVDPDSVTCTCMLRNDHYPHDTQWVVENGSVLDLDYLSSLGKFDYVYSWGVLHHTGAMWTAVDNIIPLVKRGGILFIALYNDQGAVSKRWARMKTLYNQVPWLRPPLLLLTAIGLYWRAWLKDFVTLSFLRRSTRQYAEKARGMAAWTDLVDWAGGYPFEVATPDEVIDRLHDKGLQLVKLKTRQGTGNNEFIFRNQ